MTYTVKVYESNITAIFAAGGEGYRWNKAKADAIKDRAIILAPKRTGALAASHRVTQERDLGGRFQSGFRISAGGPGAEHAAFVHFGTGIHGPGGRGMIRKRMVIPASGHGPGPWAASPLIIRKSRGQRAQPWLERAAAQVV